LSRQQRVVILVDFDYFFAQCEEVRNPALKEKPVVVGVYSGRTEDSGAVSTANYVARKFGVKSGISLYLAKKKLEFADAVFLPVDFEFYEHISDRIMSILEGYADVFEQVGIDEAFLDVTEKTDGSFEVAHHLAKKMKEEVENEVGIAFSVGLGPNKLVAKIAADSQKPNGLTVVRAEEVKQFLSPLPVDRLVGVGRKIASKMAELGIKSIGDLADYSVQKLVHMFGKKLGVYFHNAANGTDDEPVREKTEAMSISRIATLKENTCDLLMVLERANQLIMDVHKELVHRELDFKQVGIIAIMEDLRVRSRSKTLETHTDNIEVLKRTVRELFEKFLGESDMEIRRIGVKISQFSKKKPDQRQLTSFF
jgi:DNA polymerase IV (DinB-like DNA polymerase)